MTIGVVEVLMLLGIPSILSFMFQILYGKIVKKRGDNKVEEYLIKKALQAILRDRLLQLYDNHINAGEITVAEKDNYNNLYDIYHRLGKNGVMDDMYKQVLKLKIIKTHKK